MPVIMWRIKPFHSSWTMEKSKYNFPRWLAIWRGLSEHCSNKQENV